MKSGELVKRLQELDPSGEIEVIGSGGDIYFAELDSSRAETLLIHDPKLKGNAYSIVGLQIGQPATPTRPDLIVLHEMGLDDVLLDCPDTPITMYYTSQWLTKHIEDTRKRMKKIRDWSERRVEFDKKYPRLARLRYLRNKYFWWPVSRFFKRISNAIHSY